MQQVVVSPFRADNSNHGDRQLVTELPKILKKNIPLTSPFALSPPTAEHAASCLVVCTSVENDLSHKSAS